MELYLFNPDADMALGNNEENYMAPAAIRQMAQELALLPLWYARPGSGVLAASAYNAAFLEQVRQPFGLDVQLLTPPELPHVPAVQPMPWGWNPAIRKRLLRAGVEAGRLPSPGQLVRWRELAGRHTALEVLASFGGMDDCCGEGACLFSVADCEQYRRQQGPCLFKAPWSGSGKGLLWCSEPFSQPMAGRCRRLIAEQGFVVGTPLCHRVIDFAMEFSSDGLGGVSFVGYSLFRTNDKGGYAGNELMSDALVEQRLAHYLPRVSLERVRRHLQGQLAARCADYAGPLGVDMMVCLDEATGRHLLFPCVEINLRMNMGVLSRLFADRFLLPTATGLFCIESFATPDELHRAHADDLLKAPPIVHEGKLLGGYHPLVPITPKSRYRAYVKVTAPGA